MAAHNAGAGDQLGQQGCRLYRDSCGRFRASRAADLKALVADMNAGKVEWLVMLGVNPLYNAPADLDFEGAFNKVPNSVHLGSHVDETGFYSTWHLNKAHYLESWSDARAYDGTISIVQPMIDPLYGGKSAHDVFQALLDPSLGGYDVVVANAKTYMKSRATSRQRGRRRCMMAGSKARRLSRRRFRRRLWRRVRLPR